MKNDYGYLTLDPNRPVLFLDLCGVLNNCLSSTVMWYPDSVKKRWLNHDHVEAHKADLLFALLTYRGVQVVMVSSWVRSGLSKSDTEIQSLIDFFGYLDIAGSVNTGGGCDRGNSVLECVDWHRLTRWAVLDDAEHLYNLTAMGPSRLFTPHGRYGLTDQLLEGLDSEAFLESTDETFVPPWRLT